MAPPIDQLTKHGHDLQFGTNVLGHFYLTQLLLPTLIASAKSSPEGKARVVNVSSTAHLRSTSVSAGGPVLLDTLVDGPKRRQMGTGPLYSQSKSVRAGLFTELDRVPSDSLQSHTPWDAFDREIYCLPTLLPGSMAIKELFPLLLTQVLSYHSKLTLSPPINTTLIEV